MAQSNEQGGDGLRKEVIARLRAYRHANTNDVELLTLTIDRPEAVEIDEADNLMNLVADSFLQLILADRKQHELEARIAALDTIHKRLAGSDLNTKSYKIISKMLIESKEGYREAMKQEDTHVTK